MKQRLIHLSLGLVAATASAAPPSYTYHALAEPSGWQQSFALSMNSSGQVVGFGGDASTQINMFNYTEIGPAHGVFWNGGVPTVILGTAGSTGNSACLGINDNGVIVGNSTKPSHGTEGFWVVGGVTQALLSNPTSISSLPIAVNASGDAAGGFRDASGSFWTHGQTNPSTVFSASGVFESQVFGLNNAGDVVGRDGPPSAGIQPDPRPWVYSPTTGQYRFLEAPTVSGVSTYEAYSLNNHNVAVGLRYPTAGGPNTGCYWDATGHLTILNDIQSFKINDNGWIIGSGSSTSGFLYDGALRVGSTTYKFSTLLTNNPGGRIWPIDINSRGDVCGMVIGADGNYHAFYATLNSQVQRPTPSPINAPPPGPVANVTNSMEVGR